MGKENQSNKGKRKLSTESVEKKEKVVTRYDRKMEERKRQAERERFAAKRWKMGAMITGVVFVCILTGMTIRAISKKQSALKDTYITVGNHELTKLEYDFYYNTTANNYINTYYSYLSYMGLDPSKNFAEQNYSGNLTWKDNFDQMAVDSITEVKAVTDDAKAQNFEYDITENYNAYIENINRSASDAKLSVARYYTASFGTYATQSNVEPFIKEMLFASAYMDHLKGQMAPSEEEITSYYEENKNNYDKVNYHEFPFRAALEEGADEETIAAAMSELNAKADEMARRLGAGEDFETLCEEYADEEKKADYSNTETEYSFHQDATYFSIPTLYAEWLYEAGRKAQDLNKVEDTENHIVYVVRFDERIYDESCRETISDRLVNQEVNDYVAGLKGNYALEDRKGELAYLVKQETTTGSTEESETSLEKEGETSGE